MSNEVQVIVATIAFGMGINKRDVRFVIHYSLPKSLEGYSQECGRGGRDGKLAECILYYKYADRSLYDFFIVANDVSSSRRKTENIHALYSILDYCEEPFSCRRQIQLNYLGENFEPSQCNKMCDNCRQGIKIKMRDASNDTMQILRIVQDFADNNAQI